jgi:hypothetical protein
MQNSKIKSKTCGVAAARLRIPKFCILHFDFYISLARPLGGLLSFAFCVLIFDLLTPYLASACRYNVRETGFVDFGIEPYVLYGYVTNDTPNDVVSSFEQISYAGLMESNIEFEIINTDNQEGHPAMQLLAQWQIQSFPSAVLVSPDGQSLHVPLTKPAPAGKPDGSPLRGKFKDTLWSVLENISSSPKRDEILLRITESYGVVLLIEGTDRQQNNSAKEAALAAIEEVASQLEYMPKPVTHPPALVVMDSESISRETVLLWSLGLDADKIETPYAAVLYGKARWIGPLFNAEQITERNLASVLFVIGADCECGFDYRWLRGTMLPAKWEEKLQARITETLGFDPENPMIKAEMSRIIGRGYAAYPGVPFGYSEIPVQQQARTDTQQTTSTEADTTLRSSASSLRSRFGGVGSLRSTRDTTVEPEGSDSANSGEIRSPEHSPAQPAPIARQPIQDKAIPGRRGALAESELYPPQAGKPWQRPLYFLAVLTVSVITVGLFIVFRAARKNL